MPRPTFLTGHVVTAGEMNSLGLQVVQVFATSAARAAAYSGGVPAGFHPVTYLVDTPGVLSLWSGTEWIDLYSLPDVEVSAGSGGTRLAPRSIAREDVWGMLSLEVAGAPGWIPPRVVLSGGVVTEHDGHIVHAWETPGSYTAAVTKDVQAQIVAVGAGGDGVNSQSIGLGRRGGGGGGGGGLRTAVVQLRVGTVVNVQVSGSNDRNDSIFRVDHYGLVALRRGSGRGAGGSNSAFGLPQSDSYGLVQGYRGGGLDRTNDNDYGGAGGGGYGGVGGYGALSSGGAGGVGFALPWWSTPRMLCEGGSGGAAEIGSARTTTPPTGPGSGGLGGDNYGRSIKYNSTSGQPGAVYIRYALPGRRFEVTDIPDPAG